MSRGRRCENNDIFLKKMRANRPTLLQRWPQVGRWYSRPIPAGWLAGCSSVGRYSNVAGVSQSDCPCVLKNSGRWPKRADCSSSMQLPCANQAIKSRYIGPTGRNSLHAYKCMLLKCHKYKKLRGHFETEPKLTGKMSRADSPIQVTKTSTSYSGCVTWSSSCRASDQAAVTVTLDDERWAWTSCRLAELITNNDRRKHSVAWPETFFNKTLKLVVIAVRSPQMKC